MRHFFYLSVFCVLVMTACTNTSFKKGDAGLEYKIIPNGSGNTLQYGEFMQFHIKQVYSGTKDSMLQDSRDFMPRVQMFDSVNIPVSYYKILKQARKGDSLVIRMLTDSLFKDASQPMPPFMKKGKFIYLHFSIMNIFKTQDQADSANKAEAALARPRMAQKQREMMAKDVEKNRAQIEADGKIISDYLAKNNIKASRTKWGTYVAIKTEGTGEPINGQSVVTVNYTGKTLDSAIVFDSNVDPKFGHVMPYDVNMEQPEVILGWVDAFYQLKKGSKATIFIPSSLGYGVNGNGQMIKPNANLVFDVEIVDVQTQEQLQAKQEEMQRKMMELEKLRADSLNKTQKK